MNWTDADDTIARCGCGTPNPGCLSAEPVARITIDQIPAVGYTPFQRKDFLPPKAGTLSNVCGDADGASVVRCGELSSAEIRLKSKNRATEANRRRANSGKPPNQFPKGALIAYVADLRKIRAFSKPDIQAVFVYDDPTLVEPEHAVLRITTDVPDEEVSLVLEAVRSCFAADETVLD